MHGNELTLERIQARLFANIVVDSDTQCWVWQRSKYWNGYSIFRHLGEVFGHRVSFRLFVGEIPQDKYILHSCDNRACVNPAHLRIGDHAENQAEMATKNRCMYGERHTHAKLTEQLVKQMRSEYIPYVVTVMDLAKKYGIGYTAASKAISGETWRRVE